MELSCEDGSGWRARVTRKVETVTAKSGTDAMGLFLIGSDSTDEVNVGDYPTQRDICFTDRVEGTRALKMLICRTILADAIREEATEFIGCAATPD